MSIQVTSRLNLAKLIGAEVNQRSHNGLCSKASGKMVRAATLALLGLGLILAAAESSYAAPPSSGEAAAFIGGTASRLVAVIDGDASDTNKAIQLQRIVDETVDTENIAKFCLGRFWQDASPSQRQSFMQLFHSVLLDGVTGQIRNYKGVTVTVGHAQAHDLDTVVPSVVARPNKRPANVDWVVVSTAAGLKINDIVAEGTSLRLTRRSDYAGFLTGHGGDVEALLAAMRRRLAQP